MLQRDREVDNNFSKWHKLYRRFDNEDYLEDRLIASRISYKNASVNWSKYSKPWDVIFDYPNWGYSQLSVRHLPSELPKEKIDANAKLHSFMPEHKPLSDNYSHTEIVTYKEKTKLTGNFDLPSIVKKEFRTIVSDRSVVLAKPKGTQSD